MSKSMEDKITLKEAHEHFISKKQTQEKMFKILKLCVEIRPKQAPCFRVFYKALLQELGLEDEKVNEKNNRIKNPYEHILKKGEERKYKYFDWDEELVRKIAEENRPLLEAIGK